MDVDGSAPDNARDAGDRRAGPSGARPWCYAPADATGQRSLLPRRISARRGGYNFGIACFNTRHSPVQATWNRRVRPSGISTSCSGSLDAITASQPSPARPEPNRTGETRVIYAGP